MKISICSFVACAALATSTHCLAAYNVSVTDNISVNGAWSGGTPDVWTPSGVGSNVSVADIQSRLLIKGVTITTSGGGTEAGDISVNNALSWSTNTLTLTAARDISIDAVMTAQGNSALAMSTAAFGTVRTGFAPGGGFAGRVDFPGRSGTGLLTVNGAGYTVINSLGAMGSTTGTDLQGINGALSGRYALGADIDASTTLGWVDVSGLWGGFSSLGHIPLPYFTGSFDGLGHTVNNLYVKTTVYDEIGLFGSMNSPGMLRNVGLVNINLTGATYVGGLVGNNNFGVISNVYTTGTVNGDTYVGGLIGFNKGGTISDTYAGCRVSGVSAIGGLVGYCDSYPVFSKISNAYATGTVNGTSDVGGLVGHALTDSAISNSYATGSVTGQSAVGGFVGFLDPSSNVVNSYATGKVTGSSLFGGLVGSNPSGFGVVTSSFWDTQTSGMNSSAGGVGNSTADMQKKVTFNGWNIVDSGGSSAVWRIYEGQTYPLLRGFLTPLAVIAKDVTKVYDGTPYYDTNGVTYVPSGYDPGMVLGTLTYSFNPAGGTDIGSYSLIPGGLYSNQQGYDLSYVTGTLSILPALATLDIGFAGAGGNKVESTAPDASINCLKGSPTGCSAGFAVGTPVTLKATADWKSTFLGWSGDYSGADNPATFSITASGAVLATFDAIIKVKLVPDDIQIPASLHAGIQDACDAVQANGTADVLAQEYIFREPQGVVLGKDSAKTITLKGGYRSGDENYDTVTGMTTVLGPVIIIRGRLNVQGLNVR